LGSASQEVVIPAKAGIHAEFLFLSWIPAFSRNDEVEVFAISLFL
jgi:hypothetical protein